MRLDHIAYRTKDRSKTAQFFIDCFGYRIADDLPAGFKIEFDDGSNADCLVLLPPEQSTKKTPWEIFSPFHLTSYHMPPEIFISDGSDASIVSNWVKERGGVGGIHHMAYQVDSIEKKMEEWKSKGYAEFASDKPMTCPGLRQIFTKPSELSGIIYELIERDNYGFCQDNVRSLMESTKKF